MSFESAFLTLQKNYFSIDLLIQQEDMDFTIWVQCGLTCTGTLQLAFSEAHSLLVCSNKPTGSMRNVASPEYIPMPSCIFTHNEQQDTVLY